MSRPDRDASLLRTPHTSPRFHIPTLSREAPCTARRPPDVAPPAMQQAYQRK